ncbi:MAG: beta-ketoacyl synthase N-terminal-like domain-containing protein [Pseudoclavibacter sp.]|nr:beta-ketoacyl synthase N-terminal-like domain-containing protein [Pseudoclavibacter sp.]
MADSAARPAEELPRIVAARRTPVAVRGGRLRRIGADELAAAALRAALDDVRACGGPIGRTPVDDVVLGNCMGPGGNIGRVAALRLEGSPPQQRPPGLTVDRQCGSGLAAIGLAADAVRAGSARFILAGGTESASTAPPRLGTDGLPYARAPFAPPGMPDPDMVEAAQLLAEVSGVPRAAQDAFAVRSHRLALRAADTAELCGIPGLRTPAETGPLPDAERLLPRFAPLLGPGGTVTAGNSSRNADGAAALALADPRLLPAGTPGLAVRCVAVVGGDPALPGLAAAEALRSALERSGVPLARLRAIELVEAFAGQALAVLGKLGLASWARPERPRIDPRVNAAGGTLALGHPWGASGAIVAVRLFHRLLGSAAPAGALGAAAAAIGGGMGIAMLAELVR